MTMPILLMTRPRGASERFVAGLETPAQVIYAPLIQIAPTHTAPAMATGEAAIFSSVNGVDLAPEGAGRPAFCVGKRTAARADVKGWQVQVTALDADDLVAQMATQDHAGPIVHLSGVYRRGDIAERLTKAGRAVRVHELYTQTLLPLAEKAKSTLTGEAIVIVPLFSPRTAAHFASEAQGAKNIRILAMSGSVADALGDVFANHVQTAAAPTGDDMRRGVENLLAGHRLP